jgi:hypothetical protein
VPLFARFAFCMNNSPTKSSANQRFEVQPDIWRFFRPWLVRHSFPGRRSLGAGEIGGGSFVIGHYHPPYPPTRQAYRSVPKRTKAYQSVRFAHTTQYRNFLIHIIGALPTATPNAGCWCPSGRTQSERPPSGRTCPNFFSKPAIMRYYPLLSANTR